MLKELDVGHRYSLPALDGDCVQIMQFVKREGKIYPGNVGSYPGTTSQAVIRVLIARAKYVNAQIHNERNLQVIEHLRTALLLLEDRAAERHGKILDTLSRPIEDYTVSASSGHLEQLWIEED